jgi:acetyltransferase-like isoleucine patch superfamily enzyme
MFGPLRRSRTFRRWLNGRRHPGLAVDAAAELAIAGSFAYGAGCGIGRDDVVTVPGGASLAFADGVYCGRAVELAPGGTIAVGRRTSLQDRCIVIGDVAIGAYCLFAPNVYVSSRTHRWRDDPPALIRDQDARARGRAEASRPVRIEDDCWIGINVVVMPGVVIGRGCVVGANAVVTRDLPPYTVAAGAPARALRQRLAFAPPAAISAADPAHLPYFYRGFRQMADERLAHGLPAERRFSFALAAPGARALTVAARGADGTVLRHGGAGVPLAAGGGTCRFEAVAFDADGLVTCTVEGPGAVVVAGAALA